MGWEAVFKKKTASHYFQVAFLPSGYLKANSVSFCEAKILPAHFATQPQNNTFPPPRRQTLAKPRQARHNAPLLAGVAQLVEHLTCNQGVASSIPAAGTTYQNRLPFSGSLFLYSAIRCRLNPHSPSPAASGRRSRQLGHVGRSAPDKPRRPHAGFHAARRWKSPSRLPAG